MAGHRLNVTLPPGFDGDADVDQEDFGALQLCLAGAGGTITPGREAGDFDSDEDLDANDLQIFLACLSGANELAHPSCGG